MAKERIESIRKENVVNIGGIGFNFVKYCNRFRYFDTVVTTQYVNGILNLNLTMEKSKLTQ